MANKKVTRKHFDDTEMAQIWALKQSTGLSHKEIAQLMNGIYNNNRTDRGINSFLSRVRRGILKTPDISSVDVQKLIQSKKSESLTHTKTGWDDEQNKRLYELVVKESLSYSDVADALNDQFGTRRTQGQITTQYSMLKRNPEKRPRPLREVYFPSKRETSTKPNALKLVQLATTIEQFDRQNLKQLLQERRDLIYNWMQKQADLIRSQGVLSRHGKLSLQEIMALPASERAKTANLLSTGATIAEEEIKNIDLLAIPYHSSGRGGRTALILPVYIQDVAQTSKTLESCLDSAVVQAVADKQIAGKVGFSPSSQEFTDRFGSLKRYNLTTKADANYESLAAIITNALATEYKGKTVKIVVDSFLQDQQLNLE